MGLNNIHKTSIFYRLLSFSAGLFFGLFYRRFIILGKENIPEGKQTIFAANHQNALMDALAMLFSYEKPIVFLARADIFKKKMVASILYFLKILPVFRPRDGAETMNQNYETFQRTSKVLMSGLPIAILPEGTHSPIKKLQPLKKGICRIAFMTAESEGFESEILIVPIGIDYTHYSRAGTDLLLIYGKPIPVSEFYHLYQENPQKAILQLRDRLSEAISALMIDVRQDRFYKTYMRLAEMIDTISSLNPRKKRIERFYETREFFKKMDTITTDDIEWTQKLKQDSDAYFILLKRNGLKEKLMHKRIPKLAGLIVSFLLSLILLPIHIFGMVFNYLPYKLPVILTKKVRDKQFLSSLHYGYGFIFSLLWYILTGLILFLTTKSLIITTLVLIVAAFAGLFAFYHYLHLQELKGRFKLWKLSQFKKGTFSQIIRLRESILETLNQKELLKNVKFFGKK
ncbi:MAG: 1-acyl-sn-glycerol-3-phosphate acyltransferase [Lentimicrobium sp.]|nr:1-acyl-sn-glycerol-3-phosphate acyltransferase [Lentimicrobium sp.]